MACLQVGADIRVACRKDFDPKSHNLKYPTKAAIVLKES